MVEMVPTKLDRVRDHTAPQVNAEIDNRIAENIRVFASQSEERITARIRELELEWDIERILETNASTLALVGTALGAFLNPWFLLIPGIVTTFLLQHATQGWCPPLPIFRRMGKRTRNEIDAEKFAMKALRGDFNGLTSSGDSVFAERVIDAVAAFRRK
jgi:hypothetical protein